MKRISLLLIVIAVMAFGSVSASAACVQCRFHAGNEFCALTDPPAADSCAFDGGGCCFEIGLCTGAAAQTSLASQYTVASVERLDEQRIITATNTIKTGQSSPQLSQNR